MPTPEYCGRIQIYRGSTLEREHNAPRGDMGANMHKAYGAIMDFLQRNAFYLSLCDPTLSHIQNVQMGYAMSTEDIGLMLRAESTPSSMLFNSGGTEIDSIAIDLFSFRTPTKPLEDRINAAIKAAFKPAGI